MYIYIYVYIYISRERERERERERGFFSKYTISFYLTRRVKFGLDFLLPFEPRFFFLIEEIPRTFIKKLAIINKKYITGCKGISSIHTEKSLTCLTCVS